MSFFSADPGGASGLDGLPFAVLHSLLRCLLGFGLAFLVATALAWCLRRAKVLRRTLGPVLAACQSLPAAALVPPAVLVCGASELTVYVVVLLGAVPGLALGFAEAVERVPPLVRRAAETMGLRGPRLWRRVVLPAALPGLVSALRQGWSFGWRALMTAELVTGAPLPGVGRLLDEGRREGSYVVVFTVVGVILFVGIAVESAVFGPWERRALRRRGLDADAGRARGRRARVSPASPAGSPR